MLGGEKYILIKLTKYESRCIAFNSFAIRNYKVRRYYIEEGEGRMAREISYVQYVLLFSTFVVSRRRHCCRCLIRTTHSTHCNIVAIVLSRWYVPHRTSDSFRLGYVTMPFRPDLVKARMGFFFLPSSSGHKRKRAKILDRLYCTSEWGRFKVNGAIVVDRENIARLH